MQNLLFYLASATLMAHELDAMTRAAAVYAQSVTRSDRRSGLCAGSHSLGLIYGDGVLGALYLLTVLISAQQSPQLTPGSEQ